ncbi:MAG: flagellar export chaperone FliS [Rhodanobacter sp.]|nr:MAG: flagellar export chaperone FliS [Rhodanobacter sp.]
MTYGYMRNASAIYQQNSVQGVVEDADPHKLVSLLLDGAIEQIVKARGYLIHHNVAAKGRSIANTVAIIGALRNSLDHTVDRTLCQRLDSLYEYMTHRLLFAQLNDDHAALDEVVALLAPIRDGWQAVRGSYMPATGMTASAR